jgi:hypothetical protein
MEFAPADDQRVCMAAQYVLLCRRSCFLEMAASEGSTLQAFVCGLAAGTIAKMGTHPLDVAKKRFQVDS